MPINSFDIDAGSPKLLKVTQDTIIFEGYEPWYSVTHMRTQADKDSCTKWVRQLIREGKLKRIGRENSDG